MLWHDGFGRRFTGATALFWGLIVRFGAWLSPCPVEGVSKRHLLLTPQRQVVLTLVLLKHGSERGSSDMGYLLAGAVAISPLLGVASVLFLITFVDSDAINPQGGGGWANTAGVLSLVWAIFGWMVTVPLGMVIALFVWMQRRGMIRLFEDE